MKESIYLNDDLAIINFNKAYPKNGDDFLTSSTFANFIRMYIEYLKSYDEDLYLYALQGRSGREAAFEIIKLFRMLRIFRCEEVESIYLNDKAKLLEFVDELYNFWKKHQRFSVISSGMAQSLGADSYVLLDSNFNNLNLSLYRMMEERIMGRKNRVYRQMQAGTNAAVSVRMNKSRLSEKYAALQEIPFIDSVMLRTPMILHPKSNKRTGMFTERMDNPISEFTGDGDTWFCYPCKIGSLLAFIYFHRDFFASAVSLGNLFELANKEECEQKPDLICLFGNEDGKDETTFIMIRKKISGSDA
ncbi:MAG: hypothetical protein ACLVJX_10565 [Merdibacter sp.]